MISVFSSSSPRLLRASIHSPHPQAPSQFRHSLWGPVSSGSAVVETGSGGSLHPAGGVGRQWEKAFPPLISEHLEDREPFPLPRVTLASASPECHHPESVRPLPLP